MLPQITKNTNTKKFEIDFSLLREDPLFGDYRKNNIPKRLTPIDGKPFTLADIGIVTSTKRRGSAMDTYDAPKPKELAPEEPKSAKIEAAAQPLQQ